MSKKKESPIAKHRDKDLQLIRKQCIETMADSEVSTKDKNEARKLLARMHHALQIDKIEKSSEKPKQESPLSPEDEQAILAQVEAKLKE